METVTYTELLDKMLYDKRNILLLGSAGSGKTRLVKSMIQELERQGKGDSILLCAPSGIAALNINGCTIQSLFSIQPYTYDIHPVFIENIRKVEQIKNAKILLIDEISMLRCEILDIVDAKLRIITGEINKPFGGLRLIFIGDLFQMEPVVQEREYEFMNDLYPDIGIKDYCFFNSLVMRDNNYFETSFDIYRLEHIFRQCDKKFIDILSEVRMGNVSEPSLQCLNKRALNNMDFNEDYQYLCITNDRANMINESFIENITGDVYYSYPEYINDDESFDCQIKSYKCPINKVLLMKKGMKIMFVINDRKKGLPPRYVNGSIGYIENINADLVTNEVYSVLVNINGNKHLIKKSNLPVYSKINNVIQKVGLIRNFPFVPSYAITIDKSQGLTLDKTAIVLDNNYIRDNQIYVALSRAKSLDDIILDRIIKPGDIRLSSTMEKFYNSIANRIIPVIYTENIKPIITGIKKPINVHLTINIKIA
ncbi:hypothetical protein FACS1894172_03180 [Spirochaetia bacterium]|nr:hypothetical protein FACS1894172_03180 [Spirochaetia bacterium]